jgi:type II restriction enzyme
MMDLFLDQAVGAQYTSASQKARVITEHWVSRNLFCPACGNLALLQYPANRPVADFFCKQCQEEFELKAKHVYHPEKIQGRIIDGAYSTMIDRITSLRNPHLLCLAQCKTKVVHLLLIPKFFFSLFLRSLKNAVGYWMFCVVWSNCL